jgi:hypothetical protein
MDISNELNYNVASALLEDGARFPGNQDQLLFNLVSDVPDSSIILNVFSLLDTYQNVRIIANDGSICYIDYNVLFNSFEADRLLCYCCLGFYISCCLLAYICFINSIVPYCSVLINRNRLLYNFDQSFFTGVQNRSVVVGRYSRARRTVLRVIGVFSVLGNGLYFILSNIVGRRYADRIVSSIRSNIARNVAEVNRRAAIEQARENARNRASRVLQDYRSGISSNREIEAEDVRQIAAREDAEDAARRRSSGNSDAGSQ